MAAIELRCLLCGGVYYVRDWGKRHTHFCGTCRQGRKREQDREAKAELSRAVENVRSAESFSEERDEELENATRNLGESDSGLTAVPDRQPVGWLAPYGSDDGRSTRIEELENLLDWLAAEAAEHPWWNENPHWCAPLHVEMPEETPAVACRDAKGTQRGYQRHVRARESACTECLSAQAEYYRAFRASRISR